MPLIQVVIRNTPAHIINQHCSGVMREPCTRPSSILSIYNPEVEGFLQGMLATGTMLEHAVRDAFVEVQGSIPRSRHYSISYNRICKSLSQEQEDAPEDEGFAPYFTLQQWDGERSLPPVFRGEFPRAQSGVAAGRPERVMDVPQGELHQPRGHVWQEGNTVQWQINTNSGSDSVELPASPTGIFTSSSEGQLGEGAWDRIQESYESAVLRTASEEVDSLRGTVTARGPGYFSGGTYFEESDAQRSTRVRAAETYRAMYETPPSRS